MIINIFICDFQWLHLLVGNSTKKLKTKLKKMNSAFAKVSNLQLNRPSKIATTLTSSTFFLYAFGQAPILKNILSGAFSCSG